MPRRQLDFQTFDDVARDLELLQQVGYGKVGNWDLSQVCQHLSIAFRGSLHGLGVPHAPWLVRTLVAPFVVRHILRTRKMMAGIKVPHVLLPADPSGDQEAVAVLLKDLHDVNYHQGEFFPHLFFGRLSNERWKQLHLIHAAHHLSFLVPNSPTN